MTSKRKTELYQDKCIACGSEDFHFTTTLQVVHNMGVKKLKEVFGGEIQLRNWGKDVNEIIKVGWKEFDVPFIHNETDVELKIVCVKCGTPLSNNIYFYGLNERVGGITIQAEIKTKLK